jgi:hypothetical protein
LPYLISEDSRVLPEINHIRIRAGTLIYNGQTLAVTGNDPADMYRALGCNYPKFFKMDNLSKWAWIGAEVLLQKKDGWLYDGLDKRNIAVVIATQNGCLEVDYRYQETMHNIPSPALFVYTLPNIMLGEICIRHGFNGEQLCEIQETFDADELLFWVRDLIENRHTSHCLFGWADVMGEHHHISLFWTDAEGLRGLEPHQLQALHNKDLQPR